MTCLSLVACGGGTDDAVAVADTVAPSTTPETESTESEPTDTSEPRTVADPPVGDPPVDDEPVDEIADAAMGMTVQRIVVSDQAILDAALALDLPVIATPGYSDREAIPSYLADRAAGIEVLAERSEVNLESLANIRPDLLLFSSKQVESSGAREQLAEIAELAELDVSTADPWRDVLRDVASAAGVPERAEHTISIADAALERARRAIGPEGLAREVSVVRCFGDSCRYLPGGTSFPGQVLDELGVARPQIQASDPEGRAFVDVSPERVDLLDGDIIVVFGTDAVDSLEQLRQNPLWSRLDAVQAGEVYDVDPAAWFTGNAIAVEVIIDDMVRILR
ncbi:MAG: iron-siderophore ABC transporter substrate-binding protein [Ilumatobacter sp.]|uniref:iron-siderophore ABC transporter substrate-binding protein n=1 Tax=Ilumatobacter sp. TaxID=1967498 RepID=UPI00391BC58D